MAALRHVGCNGALRVGGQGLWCEACGLKIESTLEIRHDPIPREDWRKAALAFATEEPPDLGGLDLDEGC